MKQIANLLLMLDASGIARADLKPDVDGFKPQTDSVGR